MGSGVSITRDVGVINKCFCVSGWTWIQLIYLLDPRWFGSLTGRYRDEIGCFNLIMYVSVPLSTMDRPDNHVRLSKILITNNNNCTFQSPRRIINSWMMPLSYYRNGRDTWSAIVYVCGCGLPWTQRWPCARLEHTEWSWPAFVGG